MVRFFKRIPIMLDNFHIHGLIRGCMYISSTLKLSLKHAHQYDMKRIDALFFTTNLCKLSLSLGTTTTSSETQKYALLPRLFSFLKWDIYWLSKHLFLKNTENEDTQNIFRTVEAIHVVKIP